jgi:acetyl-CoA carboxylase, biotin carboxylase subunit
VFKKVLIANRGEIALRVIRACKELGIQTVAIHSEVDRKTLPVKTADERVCVGPAPALKSYLNIPQILTAAKLTQADAIHPGYGFLAERPDFVEICDEHGIRFIGPSAASMRLMGDKAEARKSMIANGVPVLPGTEDIADVKSAKAFGKKHGFPLMIKAAAGGGGKGMRVAHDASELERLFEQASSEAESAFGDSRIYVEKFLARARHIEFQIMADQHGNVVHFGERDCSVQRRNQKLIEECPSLVLSEEMRAAGGEIAVNAAKACDYEGAGTVEFLYDEKSEQFFFLEMNTRIQVEHPVTEEVCGIDLVKEQLRVASGLKLSITQEDMVMRGHAIECRINAEKPDEGFTPSVGTIEKLHFPGGPGVRIDSYLTTGSKVQPFYDSLLAKVITYGKDRDEALARMRRVLDEMIIKGISTTASFHRGLLDNAYFLRGDIHTTFVETEYRGDGSGN